MVFEFCIFSILRVIILSSISAILFGPNSAISFQLGNIFIYIMSGFKGGGVQSAWATPGGLKPPIKLFVS